MTTVAELTIAADADAWRAAGFTVTPDATVSLGGVLLRLTGSGSGITGWSLAEAPDPSIDAIDGLPTLHVSAIEATMADQPNGVVSIDHIVVYTPDLERTCAAIEAATGAELRRIREVGSLRQGFHRLGGLIVEVVTFPKIPAESAVFWGLALNAVDLEAMYATLGDHVMSAPKDAVQAGRRIASFRESAALGLPVAMMTPHAKSAEKPL